MVKSEIIGKGGYSIFIAVDTEEKVISLTQKESWISIDGTDVDKVIEVLTSMKKEIATT